jgi:hypothetical protein
MAARGLVDLGLDELVDWNSERHDPPCELLVEQRDFVHEPVQVGVLVLPLRVFALAPLAQLKHPLSLALQLLFGYHTLREHAFNYPLHRD